VSHEFNLEMYVQPSQQFNGRIYPMPDSCDTVTTILQLTFYHVITA